MKKTALEWEDIKKAMTALRKCKAPLVRNSKGEPCYVFRVPKGTQGYDALTKLMEDNHGN